MLISWENPLRDNSGSRKNRKIDGDAPGQKLGSQVHKITFCWRKFLEKKIKNSLILSKSGQLKTYFPPWTVPT
jgi:hypothetical protein